MSPDVAPSHKVHNPPQWAMRPRTAPPAPVRARIAREHRNAAPESCARTRIAKDLARWVPPSGLAARIAKKIRDALVELFATKKPVQTLRDFSAEGLARQLGVSASKNTASPAFSLLEAGPLRGWFMKAAPHRPAVLDLAGLLRQATAQTPHRRIALPLSPRNSGVRGSVEQPRLTALTTEDRAKVLGVVWPPADEPVESGPWDCPKCGQRNGPVTDDCKGFTCTGCGHMYSVGT